ncbi:MAG: hypothetical protein NTX49_10325 [Chlamydiae bacterium]|nr:hypothetical protein [Chlamydiota bacterium]
MCIGAGANLSDSTCRIDAGSSELAKSVDSLIGASKHAVIYGYSSCGYQIVAQKLREAITSGASGLSGCYIYSNFTRNRGVIDTHRGIQLINGHELLLPPSDCTSRAAAEYKLPLLAIVLENCKSMKLGDGSIIPVLFCVSSSHDPQRFSIENVKKPAVGVRTCTGRELNLAYKLCYDSKLSEEIRDVAKRTFIFVKTIGADECSISSMDDTGMRIDDTWDSALKKKPPIEKTPNPHKRNWRDWLNEQSILPRS